MVMEVSSPRMEDDSLLQFVWINAFLHNLKLAHVREDLLNNVILPLQRPTDVLQSMDALRDLIIPQWKGEWAHAMDSCSRATDHLRRLVRGEDAVCGAVTGMKTYGDCMKVIEEMSRRPYWAMPRKPSQDTEGPVNDDSCHKEAKLKVDKNYPANYNADLKSDEESGNLDACNNITAENYLEIIIKNENSDKEDTEEERDFHHPELVDQPRYRVSNEDSELADSDDSSFKEETSHSVNCDADMRKEDGSGNVSTNDYLEVVIKEEICEAENTRECLYNFDKDGENSDYDELLPVNTPSTSQLENDGEATSQQSDKIVTHREPPLLPLVYKKKGAVIVMHDGQMHFQCPYCNHKCLMKDDLSAHIVNAHAGDKKYHCHICTYKSKTKGQLLKHLDVHKGEKNFQCDFCQYRCIQKSHLTRHLQTHTGRKFHCHLCLYKCITKSLLTAHIKTHTGEKDHQCHLCDYKCITKGYLSTHLKTHSAEKKYQCKHCGSKFRKTSHLARHVMIHTGEKKFLCQYCGYKCVAKSDLTTHIKTHTGDKKYQCHICPYKCIRRYNLANHIKRHSKQNRS